MINEVIFSNSNYDDPVIGPQLLAAKTRLRNRRALPLLLAPRGLVQDAAGQWAVIRHSIVEGVAPDEAYAMMPGARRGFAEVLLQAGQSGQTDRKTFTWPIPGSQQGARHEGSSWSVLARARRSKQPGIVFARAAANGEIDPLEDAESRLMCGIS
jgi:hypothetical protein